jgi:DNA-binding NtrC family response regulator
VHCVAAPSACASALAKHCGDDMATHDSRQTAPIALIVEDDPIVRELAAALLEESDLHVVECEDAEQAFAALCKYGDEIALIFADIRLPGLLDGVDLAQRVKVLWPRIAMVVTSGYPGARVDALPENVVYMPKPWLALDVLMQAERATDRAREWRAVA